MIRKKILVDDIIDFIGNDIINVMGLHEGIYIDNLSDVDRVNETTLDWVNPAKANKQEIVKASKAKVMLVDETIEYVDGKILIVVKNPKMALAQIGNHFFVKHNEPSIHPTAVIDPEATIGKDVFVGAYTVIGKATIGDNCFIDSNVKIYDCVQIGHSCNIKSGAVLGGEGFGFECDNNGNRFRFPQLGSLIINDNVEIGANATIDRGSLSDTIIGHNTKISSQCHIAHNNKIGSNVEITCNSVIAGGNIIDDNVWIAPNSSLRGYVHIGENAFVGMGAVVVKDIPAGETWIGNPAHKLEKK